MEFTFGICTEKSKNINYIKEIIESIENQSVSIPENKYEILIVGIDSEGAKKVKGHKNLSFYYQRKFWGKARAYMFTEKKRLICEESRFENVVIMHDYVKLDYTWYDGFCKYGNDWEVVGNRLLNRDGKRFIDWCITNYERFNKFLWKKKLAGVTPINIPGYKTREPIWHYYLPYDLKAGRELNKYIYYSGNYMVGKKSLFKKYPIIPKGDWGCGEDVIWANEISEEVNFNFNKYSSVHFLKQKHLKPWVKDAPKEMIEKIIEAGYGYY